MPTSPKARLKGDHTQPLPSSFSMYGYARLTSSKALKSPSPTNNASGDAAMAYCQYDIEQWVQQKQCLAPMGYRGTNSKLCSRACTSLGMLSLSLVAILSLNFGKLASKDATPFISCRTPHCMAKTSLDGCCSPSPNIARNCSLLSSGSTVSKEAMLEAVHVAARNACQGCVCWRKVGAPRAHSFK